MKAKYLKPQGFTLIELLVVMTIIAVLAGVGFSAFTKARETANKTNAIQNLSANLKNAMISYAGDNNDNFPDRISDPTETAPTDANGVFRKLIRGGYLTDEKAFAVRGTPSAAANDGDTSSEQETLNTGECHYAVGLELTATSNANYPLVWEAGQTGDDSYNPSWTKGARDTWGGSWSDGSVLIMNVGGGVLAKKLAGAAAAEEGDVLPLAPEGSETIFESRSRVNTNAAGFAPSQN